MRKPRTFIRVLAVLLTGVVAVQVAAPILWALPLSAALIRIEVNATDGDAGMQIMVDGDGWIRLEVFDPNGQRILDFNADGGVEQQGITELFFESAEPSFDVQTLDELFLRFPAGMYKFEALTDDGKKLTGKAVLTHYIPAGPEVISPEEDAVVNPAQPVVISWEPVTDSFPGTQAGVKVVAYQVIVQQTKPQTVRVYSITVPASTTQATVPPELIQAKSDYKFEVLAIETSGNQTITESTFKTQ